MNDPSPTPPNPNILCIACQYPTETPFCPACGHPTQLPRFTWSLLLREFLSRLTFEKGFFLTARQLTLYPGAFIRQYLAGHRKGFTSPLAYFLLATAISILANNYFIGSMKRFVDTPEMRQQLAMFSDKQYQTYLDTMDWSTTNNGLIMMALIVPYAFLNRLFFFRSGFNVVESLIFAFYVFGQAALASVLLYPFMAIINDIGSITLIALLFYCLIAGIAGWAFYGPGLWNQCKLLASLTISYLTFIIVFGIGITVYLFLLIPA